MSKVEVPFLFRFVFNRTINPLVIVGYEKIIECFYMTSLWPYWCPKTMKRRPCWCPKPILWELNSFRMQTLSFVPRQDKTRQWFIWSLILSYVYRLYPNNLKLQYICIDDGQGRWGEQSLANSVLRASLATNISYPTRTRGIIVN